jgi:hypothetical protein
LRLFNQRYFLGYESGARDIKDIFVNSLRFKLKSLYIC